MEIRDKRCGKNGIYLVNDNFLSEDNQKAKPPPPSLPPLPMTKAAEKEYVFVPEEKVDEEDEGIQARVVVQKQLIN